MLLLIVRLWWDKRKDLGMTFWEKCMWAGYWIPVGIVIAIYVIILIFDFNLLDNPKILRKYEVYVY